MKRIVDHHPEIVARFTPKHLVYALKDPITAEIRYIGKSSTGLQRPRRHFYSQTNARMKAWVAALSREGQRPRIIILEWLSSEHEALLWERAYIKSLRQTYDLLNIANGGATTVGRRCTEEQKTKIGNANRGRVRSAETLRRMSEAHLGLVPTQATRDKISAAKKGKRTKAIIEQSGNRYDSILAAAAALSLYPESIVRVLKGKQQQTKGYIFTYAKEQP